MGTNHSSDEYSSDSSSSDSDSSNSSSTDSNSSFSHTNDLGSNDWKSRDKNSIKKPRDINFKEWLCKNKEGDPNNVTFLVGAEPETKFILNRKKLQNSSLEFKNILNEKPNRENAYRILDISVKDFQIVIEYIFHLHEWEFTNLPDTLDLLKIVERFRLRPLRNKILINLRRLVYQDKTLFDCDNVLQAFCLFSNFRDEVLADAAREFIQENIDRLLQTEKFLGLSFQQVLQMLFRYEKFEQSSAFREKDIQSVLLKWMLHNNANWKDKTENVLLNSASPNQVLLGFLQQLNRGDYSEGAALPDSNKEQQATVKEYNVGLMETILDVLQKNLRQCMQMLTDEIQKQKPAINYQNEELKKIAEELKELQREKFLQAEQLQKHEAKLEFQAEKIKHLEEINLLLRNNLEKQSQIDSHEIQKLQSKYDDQEKDLNTFERAFCDYRDEEKTKNYGDSLQGRTTLAANSVSCERIKIPHRAVQKIQTYPEPNEEDINDRLWIFKTLKSRLENLTEEFAIGFMIDNLTTSTLKMQENYFYWAGASVHGKLPVEIQPCTTKFFMFTAPNSVAGFFAYKLQCDRLFVVKYCVDTHKKNHNDVKLAFCPISTKSGMDLFEDIRTEIWDHRSDRNSRVALTNDFIQCPKLDTSVNFGSLHASVTMKTGKRALVSVVISDGII